MPTNGRVLIFAQIKTQTSKKNSQGATVLLPTWKLYRIWIGTINKNYVVKGNNFFPLLFNSNPKSVGSRSPIDVIYHGRGCGSRLRWIKNTQFLITVWF